MARRNRSGLTPEKVAACMLRGDTQAKIARDHGVSPQYVSQLKQQVGDRLKTPREEALEHFPWRPVPRRFKNSHPLRMLRDHFEYMATGGRDFSDRRLRELASFYNYLEREDVVVEYDPEIPPHEVDSVGGFAYRRRQGSDGDLLIRVNEYTNLTERGRRLLKFPKIRPESSTTMSR
ncbi:hypothetical protein GCM10012275_15340 [Longimycelium tulufanense]|uniref:Uncharacterized protein n=1 Tax=Longimycelium tulufanense TaxID=907463 RepID=A0A8J3C702_9PSEU|nr:XRE family transcriptional regulator [Longimycelium tulufanense]GGM45217.1 hypothetical protein GCM10012275_15340 [Longimycelium tulufanense]